MLKVLFIFGTRPEAIKMALVVRELDKHPDRIASKSMCYRYQPNPVWLTSYPYRWPDTDFDRKNLVERRKLNEGS